MLDITRAKTVSDPPGNPYLTTSTRVEFIVITLAGIRPVEFGGHVDDTTDTMGDINPGNSIQVKVAFDVPPCTPTEGVVLEMHDSMLSGGVQVQLSAPSAGGD